MKVSHSEAFKSQQKRLVPATRKKGVITQIYGNGRSADLYFVDNPQTIIRKVVASYSAAETLANFLAGNSQGNVVRCVVDLFDESNSKDMIISYLY